MATDKAVKRIKEHPSLKQQQKREGEFCINGNLVRKIGHRTTEDEVFAESRKGKRVGRGRQEK